MFFNLSNKRLQTFSFNFRPNVPKRLELLVNMERDMVPRSEKWLRRWKLPNIANTLAVFVERLVNFKA